MPLADGDINKLGELINPGKRADDPVIKRLLRTLREANIMNPDYTAIKKILEEGVDGRYLNCEESK
jgi:hypothetical protein